MMQVLLNIYQRQRHLILKNISINGVIQEIPIKAKMNLNIKKKE